MSSLRRVLFLTFAAFSLALALPRTARADSKLELTAVAEKPEVNLGDDIEMTVTLKNNGDEREVTELTFDARSLSFELSVDGGKSAWDAQFHTNNSPVALKALTRKKIKNGEAWTAKLTIPAIAAGTWSVTTVYAGTTPPIDQLPGIEARLEKQRSAPTTVKVKPGPAGETQVVARMNTSLGTMTFKFFPKDALGSAINFVRIARTGYYDGKTFHRVDHGLGVIQGGAVQPDGGGEFPYSIPREVNLKHQALRVAMARTGEPNSGSCQIYICANDTPKTLDGPDGYAVFAEVVKGKDVVDTIFASPTVGSGVSEKPKTPLRIESVKLQFAP